MRGGKSEHNLSELGEKESLSSAAKASEGSKQPSKVRDNSKQSVNMIDSRWFQDANDVEEDEEDEKDEEDEDEYDFVTDEDGDEEDPLHGEKEEDGDEEDEDDENV
ncbi:hypothetical protein Droror1_Dr00003912 [Drosera rotundifolia]